MDKTFHAIFSGEVMDEEIDSDENFLYSNPLKDESKTPWLLLH